MMFHEYRKPGYFVESGYDKQLALESVDNGWAPLIEELFSFIETHKITEKIIQVKEKWGGLRIYTDIINPILDQKILEIEKRSFFICEACGEPGMMRGGGRYRTLCETHALGRPAVSSL